MIVAMEEKNEAHHKVLMTYVTCSAMSMSTLTSIRTFKCPSSLSHTCDLRENAKNSSHVSHNPRYHFI